MIDLAGPSLRAGACARAAAGQYRGEGDGYPMKRLGSERMDGGRRRRQGGRSLGPPSAVGRQRPPADSRQEADILGENVGVAYESATVGGLLAVELGVRLF
jgi:hypothetical protein